MTIHKPTDMSRVTMGVAARKRNAILGACANYPLSACLPFLHSAVSNAASAQVVLLCSNMQEDFYAFCRNYEIETVDLAVRDDIHVQSARYAAFLGFLKSEICADFEKILLTDVRDVIFQKDPFATEWPSSIVYAAEDPTIVEEPWNSSWISRLYGRDVLARMANERIVCSGTTIGLRAEIIAYLEAMRAEIERTRPAHTGAGYDQGVLNYLLRTNALDQSKIDYTESVVATVGVSDPNVISTKDRLVLKNGKAAPVVHQWDRHQTTRQYVLKTFQEPPAAEPRDIAPADPKPKPKSEPPRPEPKSEPQSEPKSESRSRPKPKPKSTAKSQFKPQFKSQSQTLDESEPSQNAAPRQLRPKSIFSRFSLPFVSVVIANYNYGHFLRGAVESALAQTYPNCECIIVDDCSTDDSGTVIEEIQRDWPSVKCVRLAKNAGQSGAILEGLAVAQGDYILLLDADDVLFPDCVAHHISVHMSSRRAVGFTCCDAVQIIGERIVTAHASTFSTIFPQLAIDSTLLSDVGLERIFQDQPFEFPDISIDRVRHVPATYTGVWPWSTTSCMFFRRDALDMICGAPELRNLRICTDNYFARTINLLTGSVLLDERLVGYRLHESNNFVRRAPLDGLITFLRDDEPDKQTYKVFLKDLVSRYAHYSASMYRAEQAFEICALIDSPESEPPFAGRSRFAILLEEHRESLERLAGPALVSKWIALRNWAPPAAPEPRQSAEEVERPVEGASLNRDAINAIAKEVWYEKQRWSFPYKLGKWIKKPGKDKSGCGEPEHAVVGDGASLSKAAIQAVAKEVWYEKQRWGLPYKIGKWIKAAE